MLWLILALLICVVLAAVVVGLVAIPARREGRAILTERGEELVTSVSERRDKVAQSARERGAAVAARRQAKAGEGSTSEKAEPEQTGDAVTASSPAAKDQDDADSGDQEATRARKSAS